VGVWVTLVAVGGRGLVAVLVGVRVRLGAVVRVGVPVDVGLRVGVKVGLAADCVRNAATVVSMGDFFLSGSLGSWGWARTDGGGIVINRIARARPTHIKPVHATHTPHPAWMRLTQTRFAFLVTFYLHSSSIRLPTFNLS
jgi:hypothetical protein